MSVAYLTAYTSAMSSLLASIDAENTNIQAGKSTPLDNMPLYLTKLLTATNNAKNEFLTTYLTETQRTQYAAGTLTIDEVIGHDLMFFFNTIQKIYIHATGMLGNIRSYPKQDTISFYADADSYTLTADQFTEEGSNKTVNDSTYEYYTVQEGDTSRIVAKRMTGDSEQYVNVLKVNNISESDFIEGTLVGSQIKVPMDAEAAAANEDNLVYEPNIDDAESYIHGSDILSDINNTFSVSATGDIESVSGIANTLQSLTARLNTKKGTMNVFTENFGLTSLGDGNQPLLVRVDKYLTDFVQQLQSDPRVESVQLDMKSIQLNGEIISATAKVSLLGSDQVREVSI